MTFQAGSTPRQRPRLGRRIAVVAAGLLLLTAGGAAALSAPPVDPPAEPLGADAELDALVDDCAAGDLAACDQLFRDAPLGSAYEEFGDTCGGRQSAGTSVLCIEADLAEDTPTATTPATTTPATGAIPEPTIEPVDLGDDADLDGLAEQCYDGEMDACDTLYRRSLPGSDYRRFADTCAGRQETGTGDWCTQSFPGEASDDPVVSDPVSDDPVVSDPVATDPEATDAAPGDAPTAADPTISTSPPVSGGGEVPAPTLEPTGLGDDAELDALAAQCYAGDLESCDDLYRAASADEHAEYREYADQCAGRQPTGSGRWCVELVVETGTDDPPATTGPVASEPVATDPVTTEPVSTEPVTTEPGAIPAPTLEPVGLGDDPELDALAQECFDGDLVACDELFDLAVGPDQFDYSTYADTCAGRQPAGSGRWCVDLLDAPPASTQPVEPGLASPVGLGDDPMLDSLAEQCHVGDMAACDELFRQAPFRSAYEEYGDTCAGRQPPGTFRYCTASFPAVGVQQPGG